MKVLRILAIVLMAPVWIPGLVMMTAMFLIYFTPCALVSVLNFALAGEWVSPLDWGN